MVLCKYVSLAIGETSTVVLFWWLKLYYGELAGY